MKREGEKYQLVLYIFKVWVTNGDIDIWYFILL